MKLTIRYLKYIFLGGHIPAVGGLVKVPAINFESDALKNLVIGILVILSSPLIFVQSSLGFIPFKTPEAFSSIGIGAQYLESLGYVLFYILKALSTGDGFPPEIPVPSTNNWRLLVSGVLFILNGVGVFWIGLSTKKVIKNHNTYRRRID